MTASIPPHTFDVLDQLVAKACVDPHEALDELLRLNRERRVDLDGVLAILFASFVGDVISSVDPGDTWRAKRFRWVTKLAGDSLPNLEFRDRGRIWKGYGS